MAAYAPLLPMTSTSSYPHLYPFASPPISYTAPMSDWLQFDYTLPPAKTALRAKVTSPERPSSPDDDDGHVSFSSQGNTLDWAGNKDTIIRLYIDQNLSMRDLIKTMTEKHDFKATKRMYHTRFTIWNVHKNSKADMKSRLAASVIDAYREDHELPDLTESERRKLLRYCKTTDDLSKDDRAILVKAIAKIAQDQHRQPLGSAFDLPVPAFDTSEINTPYSDATTIATMSTPSSQPSPGYRGVNLIEASSIPPPMSTDGSVSNVELLLACTRHYREWQYNTPPRPDSDLSKQFWVDVKSGIYYLKVGSYELAWPLLRDAGERVTALCEQRPTSLLSDLFATISPSNTMVCPQLRVQLLRLFASTARNTLGPKHPLTIICHQLQMNAEAETPVRALRLMIDDMEAHSSQQRMDLYSLKRTLVTLLRRKRDYTSAQALAVSLTKSTSRDFGADSVWTRAATTEQVHLMIDQERWNEAHVMCGTVLESGQRELGIDFPDERSVWAMEDMAEICGNLEQFDQSLAWLETAFDGGMKVWGPTHSVMHIFDKMERVRALKPGDQPPGLFWK